MKPSMPIALFPLLLSLLFQASESTTILVDGVSEWKDPIVHVGDSVIFKHKYHYSLYIFQNQRAFGLCNFTQATLLSNPNSTYTWHPSRPGLFYFTFKNGYVKATTCNYGYQKLAIKVSATPAAQAPASSPGGGGIAFINSNPAVPLPTGEVDSATITPLPISSATPNQVMLGYFVQIMSLLWMALLTL